MASPRFAIHDVQSGSDGMSAIVTLTGSVSGAVTFLASRKPDIQSASVAAAVGNTLGPYTVSVQNPGLWYFWAQDNFGVTPTPAAAWVSTTIVSEMEAVGLKLRDILRDNAAGIEALLRASRYPNTTIKAIHYGSATRIDDSPAILVQDARDHVEWAFFPYGETHTYQFSVYCIVIHPDEQTEIDFATQFGEAVRYILRQPHYLEIKLDTGAVVDNASASDVSVSDIDLGGDGAHGAVATITWSGVVVSQFTDGA